MLESEKKRNGYRLKGFLVYGTARYELFTANKFQTQNPGQLTGKILRRFNQ
jgi:hypothetical protein